MPKIPRIGSRQTIGTLQKMGFVIVRQKGSHIVMRRGDSGCVVPNHREIRVGTLSGILKQAGITIEEFLEYL